MSWISSALLKLYLMDPDFVSVGKGIFLHSAANSYRHVQLCLILCSLFFLLIDVCLILPYRCLRHSPHRH